MKKDAPETLKILDGSIRNAVLLKPQVPQKTTANSSCLFTTLRKSKDYASALISLRSQPTSHKAILQTKVVTEGAEQCSFADVTIYREVARNESMHFP